MTKKDVPDLPKTGEFLLYQTEDGKTRIEIRMDGETVWMSQAAMAELFQTTSANINIHLRNIYDEGELSQESTIKDYLTVRREGARQVQRYLDYAEDQAKRHRQIFMKDWRDKLNAFLRFNDREILRNAGKVSRGVAEALALEQYEAFSRHRLAVEAEAEAISDDEELRRMEKTLEEKGRKDA